MRIRTGENGMMMISILCMALPMTLIDLLTGF